jgi:hypothetical protein
VVDEKLRVRQVLRTAYLSLDDDMRMLAATLLQPRRSEQLEFERAVGRVLLFAGFTVNGYARESWLSDAADLLSHAPDHRALLVVECTTGPLQSRDGKLSRLVARRRALAAAFQPEGASKQETEVIAVITTPLGRSELGHWDLSGAEADNIAVLDGGALSQLLALARGGQGPAAVPSVLAERESGIERLANLIGGIRRV